MNQWRPYYSADTAIFQATGVKQANFTSFTAWRNGDLGMWFDGGPFVTDHAHLADNKRYCDAIPLLYSRA